MTCRFVAQVACDNPGCSEMAEFGIRAFTELGCSPFGGVPCTAQMEADVFGSGWSDYGDGTFRCPSCGIDPWRFEAQP